jgi:hypothetical protein
MDPPITSENNIPARGLKACAGDKYLKVIK